VGRAGQARPHVGQHPLTRSGPVVQPPIRKLNDPGAHPWGLARVVPDLHHPRVLREHPFSADAWQYALLPSAAQAVSPLSGVPIAIPSLSERSWHSCTVCVPRIYALPFSSTRYTLPMSVVSCTPSHAVALPHTATSVARIKSIAD
jgi:hypothetical protein